MTHGHAARDGSLTVEQTNDHLFQHMKDRYYVPRLAVNALRERGYQDVGIYIWLGHGSGHRHDGCQRSVLRHDEA